VKGTQIANFSIATSKEWKDDSGEKQEKTEWHNIVAFRKTAEIVGKYLTKGRQVYVEGELQTRSWEQDGVKKYRTEVIANNIQFVGDNKTATTETSSAPSVDTHDEIPF
jgi:single-strand DNA-binding protein